MREKRCDVVAGGLDAQRFPRKWRAAVQDIDEMCSYPVYEPPRGDRPQRGRLLAILNLDVKMPKDTGGPRVIDPTNRTVSEILDEKLWELAEMAAQLVY